MNDNILSGAVFGLISAIALAAAVAVIHAELDLGRQADHVAAAQAAPAPAAAGPAVRMVTLPTVTVTGHRSADAAPLDVAVASGIASPSTH